MAMPEEPLIEDIHDANFAWVLTIEDVLEIVIAHCEDARHAEDRLRMGVYLKMASRAMRCALEVYGSQLVEVPKEDKTDGK